MITNQRMRDIAVSLFKQESDRDKQKKIGASDFSDPCAYHLAKKLLGEPEDPMKPGAPVDPMNPINPDDPTNPVAP